MTHLTKYFATLTILAASIILGGGIMASATRNAPHASISPLEARPDLEWEIHWIDPRRMPDVQVVKAPDMATAIFRFDESRKVHNYIITCVTNTNWNYCIERDPYADH